jgi:head-tail adaptor
VTMTDKPAAGLLDRWIVLQRATKTQSASGEEIIDWDTIPQVVLAAQWLPAGSTEAWQAQQRLGGYVDGVFKIRDRAPRPAPDDSRILFDGRVFDVKPYIEVGRNDGLLVPVVANVGLTQ